MSSGFDAVRAEINDSSDDNELIGGLGRSKKKNLPFVKVTNLKFN